MKRIRRGNTTITRHTDHWNTRKVWLIKHYADGHYGINQEIAGRIFYTCLLYTSDAADE